jgi:hypothetical protein
VIVHELIKIGSTKDSILVINSNQKVTWFMKDTMEVKQWIINSGDIVIHTVNCYLNTNDPDHPHHAYGPSFNTMRKAVGQQPAPAPSETTVIITAPTIKPNVHHGLVNQKRWAPNCYN